MSAVTFDSRVQAKTHNLIARWPRLWEGGSSSEKFRKIAKGIAECEDAETSAMVKRNHLLAQPTVTVILPGKEVTLPSSEIIAEHRWLHFITVPNADKLVLVDTHNQYFGITNIFRLIGQVKAVIGGNAFDWKVKGGKISAPETEIEYNPCYGIDYPSLGFKVVKGLFDEFLMAPHHFDYNATTRAEMFKMDRDNQPDDSGDW